MNMAKYTNVKSVSYKKDSIASGVKIVWTFVPFTGGRGGSDD